MPIEIPGKAELKVKFGHDQRYSGGSQSITGLGFKPKIIFLKGISTGGATYAIWSMGWAYPGDAGCVYQKGAQKDVAYSGAYGVYCYKDNSNYLTGVVASLDADGFTMTWSLMGTLTIDWLWCAIG